MENASFPADGIHRSVSIAGTLAEVEKGLFGKGRGIMNDIISKAILSGLGFASLTREAIRGSAQELVKQSKLSQAEGKRLVKDFQRRSVRVEKALEKKVEAAVAKALKVLDLPSARKHAKKSVNGKHHAAARSHRAARAAKAH
jgi:polyhydroxyalkanoate synthesis regulator phasin